MGIPWDKRHDKNGEPSLQVKAYNGKESLEASLEGADLIIIPAGVPRKPGMTRDDLFNTNASIVKGLVEAAAKVAPKVNLQQLLTCLCQMLLAPNMLIMQILPRA